MSEVIGGKTRQLNDFMRGEREGVTRFYQYLRTVAHISKRGFQDINIITEFALMEMPDPGKECEMGLWEAKIAAKDFNLGINSGALRLYRKIMEDVHLIADDRVAVAKAMESLQMDMGKGRA